MQIQGEIKTLNTKLTMKKTVTNFVLPCQLEG